MMIFIISAVTRSEAEDTFLRFIRYVEHYKYQNLKGYLLTIAMNLCRNYIHERTQTSKELELSNISACKNSSGSYAEHHMTGASYAAVKSRVRQGLTKLQELLHKEDFYDR